MDPLAPRRPRFVGALRRAAPLLVLFALSSTTTALAQEDIGPHPRAQDDSYVALQLALGFGGEAEVEVTAAGVTVSGQDDLEASFGGDLQWMFPLHRYFVLGVQFGALSWKPDNASDRNLLLDVLLVPQGRLPLTDDLELTLSLPLGPMVDFWGGDEIDVMAGPVAAMSDVSPALGFEIGFLLGARFAISRDVGLVAQLGYVLHSFSHDVDVSVAGLNGSQSVDVSLGQPRLQVGVSF